MPEFAVLRVQDQVPRGASSCAPLCACLPMSLHLRIPIILHPLPRPLCRFVDVEPPRAETGPAPERSPVRARFDSPDGVSTLSVMVRNAQTVKPSLIQVNVMLGSSEGGGGRSAPAQGERTCRPWLGAAQGD